MTNAKMIQYKGNVKIRKFMKWTQPSSQFKNLNRQLMTDDCLCSLYIVSTKKQRRRIFSIILFRTCETLYNMWTTHAWVYSGHNCCCIFNEACVIPLHDTLYFNDVLQNWNSEWRKLDHSIVVAVVSQRRRRLLMSRITVDILSTFCGVFMIRYFKFMLRIFEFGVRLFCLSQKCNSSETETFYQVWALRRWGGRQSQRLAVVS